jgi:hypothetical protein
MTLSGKNLLKDQDLVTAMMGKMFGRSQPERVASPEI